MRKDELAINERCKRRCAAILTMLFLAAASPVEAEPLTLPPGVAGFADLGTIQCDYFTELLPIGPKGFRQSLMTYAQGFIHAKSGKTMDQLLEGQDASWGYDRLSEEMVSYCADNPDKSVPDAVAHLWSVLAP